MPTYSPEQALARPTGREPLWGEGLLAAALWLLGRSVYSDLARRRAALAV
ncbi:putative ABC-type transport system permease component [Klebsiella pneumoniae]|nr:putative ABC-type transport system permease component [Klebsiella pneumoniae]